ncbi:UNVERIFIED_ORG: membrane associated rhomboid family serine protease [Martelella mediterranea]
MSTLLAVLTVVVSLTVGFLVNGSPFATVPVTALQRYGGITLSAIGAFEFWRIAAAQLLHAKMLHMLFNAICIFFLGNLLESRIGGFRLFLVWLVAGCLATLLSPVLLPPPWNVGTGASQAVFAMAGCAGVFVLTEGRQRLLLAGALMLAVLPGLMLDMISAGYPKIGHLSGFLFGAIFGFSFKALDGRPNRPERF